MSKKNSFNTVTSFSKIMALILFVMLPICAFFLGVAYQEKLDKPFMQSFIELKKPTTTGKACSMEAKLCPDGSSIGRSGPNCEFAKCPGE